MIPSFLLENENIQFKSIAETKKHTFIDKTIKSAAVFITTTLTQWQFANKTGFFQLLDSRVKTIFLFVYVVFISVSSSITCQILFLLIFILFCIISKVNFLFIYKRAFFFGFIYGFLIFVPASLNIFSKGENAITLFRFSQEHTWWIYTIPKEIAITYEGIYTVFRLTLKVVNAISIVLILMSTTTFERIIKSLSFFKIPKIFLLTITLAYRFIFVLSNTIIETYYAIKMRWWNRNSMINADEIVTGRIGYLFRKSWERYEIVYQSMIARGFNGKIEFCYFEKLRRNDFLFMIISSIIFMFFIIINNSYA